MTELELLGYENRAAVNPSSLLRCFLVGGGPESFGQFSTKF